MTLRLERIAVDAGLRWPVSTSSTTNPMHSQHISTVLQATRYLLRYQPLSCGFIASYSLGVARCYERKISAIPPIYDSSDEHAGHFPPSTRSMGIKLPVSFSLSGHYLHMIKASWLLWRACVWNVTLHFTVVHSLRIGMRSCYCPSLGEAYGNVEHNESHSDPKTFSIMGLLDRL